MARTKILLIITAFILFGLIKLQAQKIDIKPIDISGFEDDIRHWKNGPGKGLEYERYDIDDVTEIADNLLKFQNADGGWPKNIDWLGKLNYDEVWKRLSNFEKKSTCDNRNTYTQIEYLSKVYTESEEEKYRDAAVRGLNFILSTQNESGGWRGADVDAITFNDELMTGIMNLFLDIEERRTHYQWIGKDLMVRIEESLRRALDVTLKCQIVVNGKKTGWCQQHDHKTLLPVKARSYELPSIASLETTSIIEFLMRFDHPDQDIIDAINSAVVWLEDSKIYGIRLERITIDHRDINENYKRSDVKAIKDEKALPIWSRYYEIETNQPFFCNRDGIKVYSLEEVDQERRIGYAWYGYWPARLLDSKYPEWKNRISENKTNNFPRDTSYTVNSVYAKLVKEYPFIKIKRAELPASIAFEENIIYEYNANRKLHLDLFHPMKKDNKLFAAVFLIHGGGWKSGDKSMMHSMAVRLSENGFVAATVEYRLSPEAKFPASIYDLKSAIIWMKSNAEKYDVDTNKIAILGCSAGGTLAVLAGSTNDNEYKSDNESTTYSSNVQAIIDIDGVLDLTDPTESGKDSDPEKPSAGKLWLGSSYNDNPQLWIDASPLTYINEQTPPILFVNSSIARFHAGRDEAIQILEDHNIYYEVRTVQNSPHSFWLFEPWFEETNRHVINFLKKIFIEE
jgi:PelA/Pel-15E family pectate lyase